MRILVLGRSGQVARAIARLTRERPDLSVVLSGRDATDLLHPGAAAGRIRDERPDAVINAAAYTAVDRAETEPGPAARLNADAVGEVASACAATGARLVHLSTDYVFDGSVRRPLREDDPVSPLGVYGRTKLEGERLALAAHADTAVLRTSWVYGPDPPNFLCTMLRLARERDAISVVDDQIGCPTAACEVARACLVVAGGAGAGSTGLFHLAQGGPVSWAGFAGEILAMSAALGGPTARVVPIPTRAYPTAARRPAYSVLDTGRLAAAFGFRPETRATTLAAGLAYLAGNGWRVA